jgi:hypothetical protein
MQVHPNAFQAKASNKLRSVLVKHGLNADFHVKEGLSPTVWATFSFRGDEYTLAIFVHEINLRQGPNLYECSLRSEFKDDATLIVAFSRRLDRLLSGYDWEL